MFIYKKCIMKTSIIVLKSVGVFIASVCIYVACSFFLNGLRPKSIDYEYAVIFAAVWTGLFLYKKLRRIFRHQKRVDTDVAKDY